MCFVKNEQRSNGFNPSLAISYWRSHERSDLSEGRVLRRRRDSYASINANEMREFMDQVVTPSLGRLQPVPGELIGAPNRYLTQIARDNSHNSLCYEMRLSFALTVGATFERNLRLWLVLRSEFAAERIERAKRQTLFQYVSDLKGLRAETLQDENLLELWELVSVARHGDGPAARRLRELNPELWAHQDAAMQAVSDRVGLRASSLRVQDADMDRYFAAVVAFWEAVSRV